MSDSPYTRPGQGDAYKTANEIAFLAEDVSYIGFVHNYKLQGKFIIPSLIPLMQSSSTINENGSASITSNNTGRTYNGNFTKTNYIYASIPYNIAVPFIKRSTIKRYSFNPQDTNLYVSLYIPMNTEFIIGFIGEDINKIRIVGINDRGISTTGDLINTNVGDINNEF